MTRVTHAIAAAALAGGALLATGCGDDGSKPDRFSALPKRTIQAPDDKTAPRWQRLATLRGSGSASRSFAVSAAALQWRTRWRCSAQQIAIVVAPAPPNSDGRATGRCPGHEIWVGSGTRAVDVRASGSFRVIVEEEVRTPLHEPAPAAARTGEARVIARGRFAPIESKGRGTALLYRLPTGRLVVRMQAFATEPNPDLEVWLSATSDPSTTRRIFQAGHVTVRALKSTIGDQNYRLPARTDARQIRSIVVVNRAQRIAYAAAALTG